MDKVGEGRHQYLGGTIQEHDEHLQLMALISLFLVVLVDTDDTQL